MVRLATWNVGRRDGWWSLLQPDGVDVALLQEVRLTPVHDDLELFPSTGRPWTTAGPSPRPWRTAIARLSDHVALRPRPTVGLSEARAQDWVVSLDGSITAADVIIDGKMIFTAVSVYAAWEMTRSRRGYVDASAHRILSDLSVMMGSTRHRLIVAGDWNILRGYGEYGSKYWKARYDSVFDRAEALGLRFVGPNSPHGRQVDPWPEELPTDSLCVPTFHHSQQRPGTATRQLDFVFASAAIANHVEVRALNGVEEWGPSDHCRILIDFNI